MAFHYYIPLPLRKISNRSSCTEKITITNFIAIGDEERSNVRTAPINQLFTDGYLYSADCWFPSPEIRVSTSICPCDENLSVSTKFPFRVWKCWSCVFLLYFSETQKKWEEKIKSKLILVTHSVAGGASSSDSWHCRWTCESLTGCQLKKGATLE